MADAENDPDRYAGVATAANGIRDPLRRANGNSDVRAAVKNKNWQCTRPAYISDSMVRKTRSGSLRSCGRDLLESITVNVWTQLDSVTEMVP